MRMQIIALGALAAIALGCDDGGEDGADGAVGVDMTPDDCGEETCDGLDNDCDGRTDEGFLGVGEACDIGDGACAATGTTICADDGASVVCDATPGLPADETCDGVDNDCNGEIDDGLPTGEACETELAGPCRAGVSSCVDGATVCVATVQPTAEICDGLDNDCDAQLDEGADGDPLTEACYDGPEGTDGVGICSPGTRSCVDGALGPCRGQRVPLEEICDAVDSDCDGVVDEGFALGDACSVGVGACAADGANICDAGSGDVTCDAAPGVPGDEACNGIDDDCDGTTDEVAGVGEPCTVGVGACVVEGVQACLGEALGCDAVAGEPGDELCNGVDDDCDGTVDEAEGVGEACALGEGACRVEGAGVCDLDAGDVVCDAEPVPPAPVEDCGNGVDDDCDGQTDEAVCSTRCDDDGGCEPGEACIDGICGAAEVCDDELDNDNDGATDCFDADCGAFEGCGPCGNRLLDPDEACDDGNRQPGDGCDADCQVEEGYLCAPPGLAECAAEQPVEALSLGESVGVPPVGGDGGAAYDDPCPAGEVIVGFEAHIGNQWRFGNGATHLQRLRAQCARLALVDGAVELTPTGPTPERGGEPGSDVPPGFTDVLTCPEGHAVIGIRLYGAAQYPSGFGADCAPIGFDGGVVVGAPVALPAAGIIDVLRGSTGCGEGAVAMASTGRAGHVLDQVGLRCATVLGACGAPSRCEVDRACRFAFDGEAFDPVFETDGNQPWRIVDGVPTSGAITHNEASNLRLRVSTPAGGTVTFRRRVSSEGCCDRLRFRVDGEQLDEWRGEIEWAEVAFDLAPGDHVIEWAYTKDLSVDTGEDRAQIDDVAISGAVGLCEAP